MSCNLRHMSAKSAIGTKQSARRPSTADSSSDEDYAGVDLISDSEDEEPDVEVAEEQAIIESAEEEDNDDNARHVPRPYDYDDNSSWNGFDDVLGGNEAYFEDHIARGHAPDTLTHASAVGSTSRMSSDDEPPRRVRFDIADDSDSDDEDDMFPDIFLAQKDLDPSFRKAIESNEGNDDHVGSSEDGSYWDCREDERRIAGVADGKVEEETEVADDKGEEESGTSSGYETDEGETTEEDLPNVAKYVPARTVLRPSTPESDESGEGEDVPVRRSYKVRGPRLGSWIHDQRRPFIAYDRSGKKLLVFNMRRQYSQPSTTHTSPMMESDLDLHSVEQSPMISNSGNLMMSAMYGHNGNFIGALGPPEAFVPFTSINADGTIIQDSPSSYDEDYLSDEDMLNVNDFLNFGEESSDEGDPPEHDNQDDSTSTAAEPPSTSALAKMTPEDQVHPLLDHFNTGIVGAFRQNQKRHQLISRSAATQESFAFSGPFGQGAIRGLKANRLSAANMPITPTRKQRSGMSMLTDKAVEKYSVPSSSPKKRKFGGEVFAHKRGKASL